MIEVDKESSLVTFKLKTGGILGVTNKKLELVENLDESCKWMVKPVDDEYFKIFNTNGTKSL
jgi:hypothetical protein